MSFNIPIQIKSIVKNKAYARKNKNMNIYVTQPFLPPQKEYLARIESIFKRNILTNQGPEVLELENHLRKYLNAKYVHYVTNGTIALQLSLRALNITDGEIITTPFSYVATISSILWEHCIPVFVDIEPYNFTIDPSQIEAAITHNTRAIMPVHVFGYACNIDAIDNIAKKYHLKVIYDAAHTFGSFYKGKSLSSYGDISTLSFHATKLFHTIEGGACIVKDKEISDKLELIKRFGHNNDEYYSLGINAKQDEFNAAMGNVNIQYISKIISKRKNISELYDLLLANKIRRPKKQQDLKYNYAYYPVIFETEQELISSFARLNKIHIYPRRYFYPSLNTIPYLKKFYYCPISEDIAKRIACLPLFTQLEEQNVYKICEALI